MNPAPGVYDQRVLKDLFSPAGRGLGLAQGRGRLCVTCVLITCRALINGSSFCLAPRTLLKTRCFISVCFPGTLIPVNNRVQTLSTWSSSKSRGPPSSPGLPRPAPVTAALLGMLDSLCFSPEVWAGGAAYQKYISPSFPYFLLKSQFASLKKPQSECL